MYLKEETTLYNPVNSYSYTSSDVADGFHDVTDYNTTPPRASATANANATATPNSSVNEITRFINENTGFLDNEVNPRGKCLFYTFFFGFIGYLLYYVFKDTV
jgi:hypothetical protein